MILFLHTHLRAQRKIFQVFLPPTLFVGTLDIFVDEDIDYAARLSQSGVPRFRVYSGAFHGSVGMVAESELSIRWAKDEN